MTPILLIKEIEPSDLEPLSKLYCDAFLKYQPDTQSTEESISHMKKYFLNTLQKQLDTHPSVQECMYDNETNDYIAYFSAFEKDDSDVGDKYVHIPEVFVNPKFQKLGYGKKIMEDGLLLCQARFENSEWVDLNTQPYNKPAIALYTKLNFRVMFIIGPTNTWYSKGPDGHKKYSIIRMAKPLHAEFAFRQYPNFDPTKKEKPIIENYHTRDNKYTITKVTKQLNENVQIIETATYPVKYYAKYTKDLYGEMIRFQYGVYEDDMSLSKKEVNRRAKRDASTLLSAQEKLPDFTVWCGVTDVSIAGYIVVAKLNGVWTFTMDHYYDTDGKVLEKLVKKAITLTKLPELKGHEDFILESMMKVDALRGTSKTKYRSVFKINDEFLNSLKEQPPEEEQPEEEPIQPSEEIPQEEEPKKGELPPNEQPQEQPPEEYQTPLPSSTPQEPELANYEKYMADKQKANNQLAKDINKTVNKVSKSKPIEKPEEEIPQVEPEETPPIQLQEPPSDTKVTTPPENPPEIKEPTPSEDNLDDFGEFPKSMFEKKPESPKEELPKQQDVVEPVQRDISKEVIKDLPKDRKISPIKIIDIDKITNPIIPDVDSPEIVKKDNQDTAKQIMNPTIKKPSQKQVNKTLANNIMNPDLNGDNNQNEQQI